MLLTNSGKYPAKKLSLLVALLLAAGCATPPQVDVQQVTQQVSAAPEISQQWWRAFDDPLLNELVADLLKQNLDLKVGLLRVQEARARRLASEAPLTPRVDASLNSSRTNSQVGTVTPETLSRGLIEVSWEADVFGANRAGLRSEDALLAESVAQAFDVRRLVIAELAQAMLDYRYASEQINQQRELLLTQNQRVFLLESRQRAGLADATALENAVAQREQTASALSRIEAGREGAQFRVERLLGLKPQALSTVFSAAETRKVQLPAPQEGLNIPLDTLKNRPDLKAAYLRLAASSEAVKKAEADFWPKLRLSSFVGIQQTSDGLDRITASNPIWAITSSLAAPVLNRLQLESNVQVAGTREENARVAYEAAVLQALQESQTFLSEYLASFNASNRESLAVERQKSALDIARKRYSSGLTDYLPVTLAEEALLRATLEKIRTAKEAAGAYVGLRKAIAG